MADGTIVWNYTFHSQQVKNVMVFSNMAVGATDLQALADDARAYWVTYVAPVCDNNLRLDSITVVYNAGLPIYSIEVPFTSGPALGLVAGDSLPTQVALLVSTKALQAPPNRGRVFIPGIAQTHNADGQWDQVAVDGCIAFIDALANQGLDYLTNVAFLRIARRNVDGTIDVTAPVDQVVGHNNPATQRRRRIGVGS